VQSEIPSGGLRTEQTLIGNLDKRDSFSDHGSPLEEMLRIIEEQLIRIARDFKNMRQPF
jgi:hypothetical protein